MGLFLFWSIKINVKIRTFGQRRITRFCRQNCIDFSIVIFIFYLLRKFLIQRKFCFCYLSFVLLVILFFLFLRITVYRKLFFSFYLNVCLFRNFGLVFFFLRRREEFWFSSYFYYKLNRRVIDFYFMMWMIQILGIFNVGRVGFLGFFLG